LSSRWTALSWKAWRESRQRFICTLAALCGLVTAVVLMSPGFRTGYAVQYPTDPLPYAKYVWLALFNFYFQAAWIFGAVLFGFGGLTREERYGVVSYTLGLPVRRSAHLLSRLAVGVVESLSIGIVPALVVPFLSPAIHERYPVRDTLIFAVLMVAAGLVFFCFGLFLSSLFGGEFTGPVVCLCVVGSYFFAIRAKFWHVFSVLDVMSGEDAIVRTTYSFGRSLPWTGIGWSLLASTCLCAAALQIAARKDFR